MIIWNLLPPYARRPSRLSSGLTGSNSRGTNTSSKCLFLFKWTPLGGVQPGAVISLLFIIHLSKTIGRAWVIRSKLRKSWFLPIKSYFDGVSRLGFNDPFTVQRIFIVSWPSGRQNESTGSCQVSATWGWKTVQDVSRSD